MEPRPPPLREPLKRRYRPLPKRSPAKRHRVERPQAEQHQDDGVHVEASNAEEPNLEEPNLEEPNLEEPNLEEHNVEEPSIESSQTAPTQAMTRAQTSISFTSFPHIVEFIIANSPHTALLKWRLTSPYFCRLVDAILAVDLRISLRPEFRNLPAHPWVVVGHSNRHRESENDYGKHPRFMPTKAPPAPSYGRPAQTIDSNRWSFLTHTRTVRLCGFYIGNRAVVNEMILPLLPHLDRVELVSFEGSGRDPDLDLQTVPIRARTARMIWRSYKVTCDAYLNSNQEVGVITYPQVSRAELQLAQDPHCRRVVWNYPRIQLANTVTEFAIILQAPMLYLDDERYVERALRGTLTTLVCTIAQIIASIIPNVMVSVVGADTAIQGHLPRIRSDGTIAWRRTPDFKAFTARTVGTVGRRRDRWTHTEAITYSGNITFLTHDEYETAGCQGTKGYGVHSRHGVPIRETV